MEQNARKQRYIIAMIFYVIAMIASLVEALIVHDQIQMTAIVVQPIIFPVFYCLISRAVKELSLEPIGIIFVGGLILGSYNEESVYCMICEVCESIFYIVETIVVISIEGKKLKTND